VNPSEYVNFRPDLTYLLSKIGLRKLVWRELQAP